MTGDSIRVRPHLRQGVAIPSHQRGAPTRQPGDTADVDGSGLRSGVGHIANEETVKIISGLRLAVLPNRNPEGEHQSPLETRLAETDFTGLDLTGVSLANCELRDATFVGANLTGANLTGARLDGADFTDANLTDANLDGVIGDHVIFDGALLAGTSLRECQLENVIATGARMTRYHRKPVDCSHADLSLKTLTRVPGAEHALWQDANVTNLSFDGVDARGSTIGAAYLLSNVSFAGADLRQVDFTRCGLMLVDLRDANCAGAGFDNAKLSGVFAQGAVFSQASMYLTIATGCTFTGAAFDGTRLAAAHFYGCRADDTSFTGANLTKSMWSDCSLRNANFTDTNCERMDLSRTEGNRERETAILYASDLTGAKWTGANTAGMLVANSNPGEHGAAVVTARYDYVPLDEFCAARDLDDTTAGMLIWAGALEARDNRTRLPAAHTVDLRHLHIPAWAAQNYR